MKKERGLMLHHHLLSPKPSISSDIANSQLLHKLSYNIPHHIPHHTTAHLHLCCALFQTTVFYQTEPPVEARHPNTGEMEMATIASPSVAAFVGPCREQAPQSSFVGSSEAVLGLAKTRCLGAHMTSKGSTAVSRVTASTSSKGNKFGKLQVSNGRRGAQGVVRVQTEPSSTATAQQKTSYYYLIANAKFMLDDEEHFQEQMQEKLRLYGERNKEQDFWIVIEPQFLEKHPEVAKRVNRPAVALVSTDKVWITFMKLRLDRVLKGEIEVDSPKEALTGNLTTVKFERPENWIAPYPKYEGEWWTPFLYKDT